MFEKENRRIKMTKQMLKEALIGLLEIKDIYHISVRELCESADVNRTTFYKYYGSQFELLTDMENDMLMLVKEAIANNVERRERIIKDICNYLEEHLQLARLLVNNNIDTSFPEKLFSMALLKEYIVKYTLSEQNESICEYLYVYQTYGAFQVIRTWLNKDNRERPEDIAKILLKIIA